MNGGSLRYRYANFELAARVTTVIYYIYNSNYFRYTQGGYSDMHNITA